MAPFVGKFLELRGLPGPENCAIVFVIGKPSKAAGVSFHSL